MKRRELQDAGASRDDRRKKLVAVYLRVSSEEQRERETILTQRSEIEPWLRERGFEVFDWYADDGVSGDVPFHKREHGARLLEDAAAGRFGTVVCFKIDRLSRRAEDALSVVRKLLDLGLQFRCSAQDFEVDSSTGKLTLTMMAAVAEFAKANILENTRAGHRRRANAGKWPYGRPAYGYRIAGDGEPDEGKLIVHPHEGPVVQRIFRLYREGLGMARIAGLLTAEGVPSPKAGKHKRKGQKSHFRWNVSTISFILHNRAYVGEALFYRTRSIREDGEVVGWESLPEEEHVPIEAPSLVTEAEFQLAQAVMERNQEFSPRNKKRNYLLGGLLFCGCCCYRYVGYAKASRKTAGLEWRYYGCGTAWNKSVGVNCAGRNVRAADVEGVVWKRVRRALENPAEFVQGAATSYAEGVPKSEDRPHMERRLADLDRALAGKKDEERRLLTAFRKGMLGDTDEESEAEFAREKAELDREAACLLKEAVGLRERLGSVVDLDAYRVDLLSAMNALAVLLDRAEEDEELRRQVIMALIDRAEVGEQAGKLRVRLTYRPRPLCLASEGAGVPNSVQDMVRNWTQLEHTETLPLAA